MTYTKLQPHQSQDFALFFSKIPVFKRSIGILSPLERAVAEFLLHRFTKFRSIFPSQETIAAAIGCSRTMVCKIVAKLCNLGLIRTVYRHRKTCLYYIQHWAQKLLAQCNIERVFSIFDNALFKRLLSPFTPYSKVNRNNYNYNCSNYSRSSCARETKRGSMSTPFSTQDKNCPISSSILHIKFLSLNRWGQIRLSAFPDAVVDAVDDSMQNSSNLIRKPFHLFFKLCLEECDRRGITPDWGKSTALAMEHGMPADCDNFLVSLGSTKVKRTAKPRQLDLTTKQPTALLKGDDGRSRYQNWKPRVYEHPDKDLADEEFYNKILPTADAWLKLGMTKEWVRDMFERMNANRKGVHHV